MMEDPRTIRRFMDVSWAARALERIGDHAKNIGNTSSTGPWQDIRHTEKEAVLQEIRLGGRERSAPES